MRFLLRLSTHIDRAIDRIGVLVGALTIVMIAVGAWNTAARHVARHVGFALTSNGVIEVQWYLFSLIFLLGASYTLKRREHVRVDVLYSRFSPRLRAWLDFLGTLLLLIPFAIAMIVFTWPGVVRSFAVHEVSPDPGGLPRYPLKAVVPLAFGLLILQALSELVKSLAAIRDGDPNYGTSDAEPGKGQVDGA